MGSLDSGAVLVEQVDNQLWNRYCSDAVEIDRDISLELVFLLAATAYAFFVPLGGGIDVVDTVVLVGLFALYIGIRGDVEEGSTHVGVPAYFQKYSKGRRIAVVLFLFAFSGLIIFEAVHHPFALASKNSELPSAFPLLHDPVAYTAREREPRTHRRRLPREQGALDHWDSHAYKFTTRDADGIALRSYVHPQLYDGGPSWRVMDDEEIDRFIDQGVPDDATEAAKERFRDLQSNPPPEGNASDTTIGELDPDGLGALSYTFDMGDNWEHYIELQETREGTLDGDPAIVDEQGDAPSQYRDLDDEQ